MFLQQLDAFYQPLLLPTLKLVLMESQYTVCSNGCSLCPLCFFRVCLLKIMVDYFIFGGQIDYLSRELKRNTNNVLGASSERGRWSRKRLPPNLFTGFVDGET